jgi:hypothetical protein
MVEFTKLQIRILSELSEEQGYSNRELTERLNDYEGNITRALRGLVARRLIVEGPRRKSTNPKTKGKEYCEIPYFLNFSDDTSIEEHLDTFNLILKDCIDLKKKDLVINLLNSNYINLLIRKAKFIKLCRILFLYFDDDGFKTIATECMLVHALVKEEYKKNPQYVSDEIKQFNSNMLFSLFEGGDLISILSKFNSIEAINFYRDTIGDTYSKLYRELTAERNISEGIKKFVDLDVFLSPFISFPVDDPVSSLFASLFERLYDDMYLCEESDFEAMVQRAYLVYSNFSEIMRIGISQVREEIDFLNTPNRFNVEIDADLGTDIDYSWLKKRYFIQFMRDDLFYKEKNLVSLIKQYIFYWNIMSLRLDLIYVKHDDHKFPWPKREYHFIIKSGYLQAMDSILGESNDFEGIFLREMMLTSLLCIDDPFINLRYCSCFKELNLKEISLTVDDIVLDIKRHLTFKDNNK